VVPENGTHKMIVKSGNPIPLQSQAGASNAKFINTNFYLSKNYIDWGMFVLM